MIKKHHFLTLLWLMRTTWISAREGEDVPHKVSTSKAGVAYGVYVDEGYAYITKNDGIIIFDVHEPDRPREVASIPTGYTPSILIQGDLAPIASS